jgi:hypothetical protein
MRKCLWILPMVLLITALGGTPAHADGIVVTNAGGYVTAIDGITLNGTLYNVTFTSAIDNTFAAYVWDNEPILGVIGAIDIALGSTNINDGEGQYYGIAAANGLTAYATSSTCCAATPWTGDFVASTLTFTGAAANEPLIYFWANFTAVPAPVPEPGTESLTLAGLGVIAVLMWKRRQHAHRHTQAT